LLSMEPPQVVVQYTVVNNTWQGRLLLVEKAMFVT
jgi:hypothetical protein